jgi:prepilin peptidase CpaA
VITLVVLLAWAAALAVLDWRQRRLPNQLLLSGLIIGGIHVTAYGTMPYGTSLLDGATTAPLAIALLWPLYRMGWMGAGDVKLCATIGWLGGYQTLASVFLIGSVIAGLLALAILSPGLARHLSGPGLDQRLQRRVPLGAALAMALLGWTVLVRMPQVAGTPLG